MDCKSALKETGGDLDEAATYLRKKGIASAEKRSGRAATEGIVAYRIDDAAKIGILVEVACETDFVARNGKLHCVCGRHHRSRIGEWRC